MLLDALRATLATLLAAARNMTVGVLVRECTDVLHWSTRMNASDLRHAVAERDFGVGVNGTERVSLAVPGHRKPRRKGRRAMSGISEPYNAALRTDVHVMACQCGFSMRVLVRTAQSG